MMFQVFFIAFLTLTASILGTMSGFGISTIMIPILLLFFPPLETLLFVGIIHFFGNIWKMLLFPSGINWKLILLFGLPGIIFSLLGSQLSLTLPSDVLQRILGLILIIYTLLQTLRKNIVLPHTTITALIGGSLFGLFAGLLGIGGAIRSAFLHAYKLKKYVYIFTSGALGVLIDIPRLINYALQGIKLDPYPAVGLILFIPTTLLGAFIAKSLLRHVPERQFLQLVALFLFIFGLKLFFIP